MGSRFTLGDMDISSYAATVAVVLLSAYGIEHFYRRSDKLQVWLNNSLRTGNLRKLVSSSAKSNSETVKEPSPWDERTWWIDEGLFRLENRAIFSKSWLFLAHASRFRKPGDYRTFEIAGFSVLLILGKDNKLRAFHNVCRHRAYTITKKESGSTIVLGCRYHGWSYDTKGKLIKAPEFDGVEGFDKDLNGLWEIKSTVRAGMVFINLDASPVSQEFDMNGENIMKRWKAKDMSCIEEWKVEGDINWKFVAEYLNLGESVDARSAHSLSSYLSRVAKQEALSLCAATTATKLATGELVILRSIPKSAGVTSIECTFYTLNDQDPELEKKTEKFKEELQAEISRLEQLQKAAAKGDENGIEIKEFQDSMARESNLAALKSHLEVERKFGTKIYPAARTQSFSDIGKADDDLCRQLEQTAGAGSFCDVKTRARLDW
ncbi:putative iron-sulfur cluster-binding protein [Xylogone sp. PMI_703]|nr:putative iron-sulfur cluster-binding protein [Xylogone sp. PMI_703]